MNQFAWSVFSGVVVYVFWIQMCYLILEKKTIVGRMWSDFNSIWCKAILEERKIKVSFSTTGKYIFVVFGIAAIQWMFRCNTCHTFLVSRVTDSPNLEKKLLVLVTLTSFAFIPLLRQLSWLNLRLCQLTVIRQLLANTQSLPSDHVFEMFVLFETVHGIYQKL